jgi:hypothetical protein
LKKSLHRPGVLGFQNKIFSLYGNLSVRVLYLVLDLGVQLASIGIEFADMEL